MRLFVGLPASTELRDEIVRWQDAHRAALPVRWLAGHNLHVTLAPPWEASDIDAIAAALDRVDGRAFDLRLTRATFAPPHAPRLIWAEGLTVPQLLALRDTVYTALDRPSERRPFRLHLTLARFRPQQFAAFPLQRLDEHVSWTLHAGSFVLFASHLSSSGAEYEVLHRVLLR